jgi:hypothetical protein
MEGRLELKRRVERRLPEMISVEEVEHTVVVVAVEEEVIVMVQEEVDKIGTVVMMMGQEGDMVVLVAVVMVQEEMIEEEVEMIVTVAETTMIDTMIDVEVEAEVEAVLAAQDTGPGEMIADTVIVAAVLLLGVVAREGTATEMRAGERAAVGLTVIKYYCSGSFPDNAFTANPG